MPRPELMAARYRHYALNLDPLQEQVLSLSEMARLIGISSKSLRDCAKRGRRAPGGERIRLEVCLMPGGLGTSQEACLRFLRRLNGIREAGTVPPSAPPA